MVDREQDLLCTLQRLFSPHVENAIGPRIADKLRSAPLREEEASQFLEFAGVFARSEGHSITPDQFEALRGELKNPKPFTDEEIALAIHEEVEKECALLVSGWVSRPTSFL